MATGWGRGREVIPVPTLFPESHSPPSPELLNKAKMALVPNFVGSPIPDGSPGDGQHGKLAMARGRGSRKLTMRVLGVQQR